MGYLRRIAVRGHGVVVEYEFEDSIPPFPFSKLKPLLVKLDSRHSTETCRSVRRSTFTISTNHNDENLLEITGNPELAQHYLAEFMRLYEHYRARALWNRSHQKGKKAAGTSAKAVAGFTLKLSRDEWVKGAYQKGTPEFLARTKLS